ncbi:hypothetical protein BDR04DRAFT_339047 [Suillus decipiens]|nr:hypothetical protein BDR04DRAFT_339047 [Suillus decipiens]
MPERMTLQSRALVGTRRFAIFSTNVLPFLADLILIHSLDSSHVTSVERMPSPSNTVMTHYLNGPTNGF